MHAATRALRCRTASTTGTWSLYIHRITEAATGSCLTKLKQRKLEIQSMLPYTRVRQRIRSFLRNRNTSGLLTNIADTTYFSRFFLEHHQAKVRLRTACWRA